MIKFWIVLFILAFFKGSAISNVKAQVKNEQTIQRIESGNYKFAKGEIEITLVDTVSKDYAESYINKAGYEILSSSISPIEFILYINKNEFDVSHFEENPLVQSVFVRPGMNDSLAVEEMIVRQKMNEEQAERSRKRFREMRDYVWVRIAMQYWVTEQMAYTFKEQEAEYKLQAPKFIPRSMVIKTIPGKENEAMRELKRLQIVESTAYIALIEN